MRVSYTVSKICIGEDFLKRLNIYEIFQTKHIFITNATKEIEIFLELLAKFCTVPIIQSECF